MQFIKANILKLLSLSLVCFHILGTSPTKGRLNVIINGIKSQQGSVRVAIYNSSETFLDEKKFVFSNSTNVGKTPQVQLSFDVPYGTYSVSCYHDVNNDTKLDKSSFGFPVEPYAFSGNDIAKWRKPTFNETKFTLQEPQLNLNLQLKHWKER
ncbi:MAG TPA: DUF2141 domain-containing protein, partial [Allocoleopsis sp.]